MTMSHRETYPDQYEHALVGQTVKVLSKSVKGAIIVQGRVERVVCTQFGPLADIVGARKGMFYAVRDCVVT